MRLDVSTSSRGPIFDGRAQRVANAFVNRYERNLAEEGRTILLEEMRPRPQDADPVLRDPHRGRRRQQDLGQPRRVRAVAGGHRQRNYPVTRFKGYDHWIKTRHRLNERKRGIGERLLRQYTGRM
jgi:hypothetical protein